MTRALFLLEILPKYKENNMFKIKERFNYVLFKTFMTKPLMIFIYLIIAIIVFIATIILSYRTTDKFILFEYLELNMSTSFFALFLLFNKNLIEDKKFKKYVFASILILNILLFCVSFMEFKNIVFYLYILNTFKIFYYYIFVKFVISLPKKLHNTKLEEVDEEYE